MCCKNERTFMFIGFHMLYFCVVSFVFSFFPEWNESMHFHYNISYLSETEKILAAEFHVFKMRPTPSISKESKPPYVIEVTAFSYFLFARVDYNLRFPHFLTIEYRMKNMLYTFFPQSFFDLSKNFFTDAIKNFLVDKIVDTIV